MKKLTSIVLISILLVSCLVALMVAGCTTTRDKYLTIMSVSNQTSDSFSMDYDSFDGVKHYKIRLKQEATISMTFTTTEGTLDCAILDHSNSTTVYEALAVPTSTDTVTLPKGTYVVRFTGDHHRGGWAFTW